MKWAKKEVPSVKRYKWFAWYPVLCDNNTYRWLEIVKVTAIREIEPYTGTYWYRKQYTSKK